MHLPLLNRTRNGVAVTGLAMLLGGSALAVTPTTFTPGKLAVMQLGDGGTNRGPYAASDLLGSRQNPIFIDQFDPNGINQTIPSVQILVPTNGPGAMFVNGNAGTEGNLSLAGDKSVLAFGGYQGDILSIATGQPTAPSNLSYDRGIGTMDAFGNYANPYRGPGWYGVATGKTNPRGTATDGLGNFWGCGNGYGSLFFNAITAPDPIQFQNVALTSCAKIINNALYCTVKTGETVSQYPPGLYSFVDYYGNPAPYPAADGAIAANYLHLEIPANASYQNCIGFDVNPQNTVAYMADAKKGIQKYVKVGLDWVLAYNFGIPGYTNNVNGVLADPANTNFLVGCFSVTVDWTGGGMTGTNPVVYATTADSAIDTGAVYYGNRVIRIDDTNTVITGGQIIITTNMNILTTVARPGLDPAGHMTTNVVYKSVTFTPDLRPAISANPADWSAYNGDTGVSFSVTASSAYAMSYQWLSNGTPLANQTNATLSLSSVALSDDGTTNQCIVSNDYGAVTSSIARLTVTGSPVAPVLAAARNLTNYVGSTMSFSVNFAGGNDPKGGYQWYLGGVALNDGTTANGSILYGTTTRTLTIAQGVLADAGAYSVDVTNAAGSISKGLVANLAVKYQAPIMIELPTPSTTFFGRKTTNTAAASGVSLGYQWYKCSKTTLSGATLTLLSDVNEFSGTATPQLAITGATNTSATNYVVVITNPGGSITSAPVTLTVLSAPPHTFVNYTGVGSVYFQNFNSLPIPGQSSAEGANPQHMAISMTNFPAMIAGSNPGVVANMAADVTYSMDNPLDFGYPVYTNGFIGGLGLSNTMPGWYGWSAQSLVFSATKGDQMQGAIVDNGGNYYQLDGYTLDSITNRALGLVASSKTGQNAIGVKFVNNTGKTLNTINLSYLGELWRNKAVQQPLVFGYTIDAAGTNSTFQPDVWDSTNGIIAAPSLDVRFATGSDSILVGSQPANQISLAVTNMAIGNWPPGAALWLTWRAQTLGNAQDVAIDNLSFSATGTPPNSPVTITAGTMGTGGIPGGAVQFSFTNAPGVSFSVLTTTNLSLPYSQWQNLGSPVEGPAGHYQFHDSGAANKPQQYYLISWP
jgi:hypothetical protein